MDPQSEKTPGLHLPQPSVGEGVSFHAQYEEMPQRVEAPVAPPEKSGGYAPHPQPVAVSQPGMAAVPSAPAPTGDTNQPQQAAITDDDATDDLDKEWISKAKSIVEQTKNDPYTQSREIGRVKADYLRIRYNKHIKVGQDRTL